MLIYVCGPYSDNPEKNMRKVEKIGIALTKMGHVPFMPHKHTFGWEKVKELTYDDFIRIDLAWLGKCDAVFRFGGISRGVERELTFSRTLSLPIYYNLEDVPKC